MWSQDFVAGQGIILQSSSPTISNCRIVQTILVVFIIMILPPPLSIVPLNGMRTLVTGLVLEILVEPPLLLTVYSKTMRLRITVALLQIIIHHPLLSILSFGEIESVSTVLVVVQSSIETLPLISSTVHFRKTGRGGVWRCNS